MFAAIVPLIPRVLAALAHRTAAFRYRDYLPVVLLVGVGAGVAMAAGDEFLDLAELVQANNPRVQEADQLAHAWARDARTPGATLFFTVVTIIGTPAGLGIIVAAVCTGLAIRRRWRWMGYLIVTAGVGGLLNLQLKAYFARARPELAEALRNAHGYSFPSGHAMGSAVVFGALAYLAFRAINSWKWRAAALALGLSMIVSISASRVYLGVHWISDIGAGVAAGFLWVITTTVAYETFRRIRLIRSLRRRAAGA